MIRGVRVRSMVLKEAALSFEMCRFRVPKPVLENQCAGAKGRNRKGGKSGRREDALKQFGDYVLSPTLYRPIGARIESDTRIGPNSVVDVPMDAEQTVEQSDRFWHPGRRTIKRSTWTTRYVGHEAELRFSSPWRRNDDGTCIRRGSLAVNRKRAAGSISASGPHVSPKFIHPPYRSLKAELDVRLDKGPV